MSSTPAASTTPASMASDADLRYPVGRYTPPARIGPEQRARWIETIAAAPAALRRAVQGLSDAQLDTPYRPGGWTVRQVAHHVPDSHMNAYVRFKLALTEDSPTIKPYEEARWAELPDSAAPVAGSLQLLELLHERWVRVLRAMSEADWTRTYVHPEQGRAIALSEVLGSYAWHCEHHVAHVTRLRERMGW